MITTSQKSQAQNLLNMAFDTFKRPIVYYRYPSETITESKPSYNFAYPEEQNTESTIVNTPVSGVVDATIEYITLEDAQKLTLAKANVKYVAGKEISRICVRPSGAALLEVAERIEYDGKNHNLLTSAMPRGIFEPDYYDFWLQVVD